MWLGVGALAGRGFSVVEAPVVEDMGLGAYGFDTFGIFASPDPCSATLSIWVNNLEFI